MEKVNVLEMFMNSRNIFYIEKDACGNIICDDMEQLELYREIILSDVRNENSEIYHKKSKSWYKLTSFDLLDEDTNTVHFYDFLEDITSFKERERELQLDNLTSLMKDRDEANKQMSEYITYALDKGEEFALVVADVDYFKKINDTYGHDCGDYILQKLGPLLLRMTRQTDDPYDYRKNDIVTRFGGDEFVILLKKVSDHDAKKRISEIKDEINNLDLIYDGYLVPIQMSFGCCHVSDNTAPYIDAEKVRKKIFKKADADLYIHKNKRGKRI